MEDNNKPEYRGRSTAFIFALVFTFIISTISLNFDITAYYQRNEIEIPTWFFGLIFLIDLAIVASLGLIYFYRKIGVYLFPIAVLLHFILQNYYLSSFLYFDIFMLFLFFLLILMAVIPRWPNFK